MYVMMSDDSMLCVCVSASARCGVPRASLLPMFFLRIGKFDKSLMLPGTIHAVRDYLTAHRSALL